jgi:thiamine kinase-like enzyme
MSRVSIMKQDQLKDIELQVNRLLNEENRLPVGNSLRVITFLQHQASEGLLFTLQVEKNKASIPEYLILKIGQRNHREIAFYQSVMGQPLPVPSCLAAKIDPASGNTMLLCTDISHTHTRLGNWESQPPDPVIQRVVEGVAHIQAYGWEHPQIGNLVLDLPSVYANRQEHNEFVGWLERDADAFFQAMQHRVSAKVVERYALAIQRLRADWEQIWLRRIENCEHLTLVHGDLHPGNIFYPIDKEEIVRYIDWEAFRLDLPTTDLVMLLALHLAPQAEQALPLLKAYHAALLGQGISNYSFQNLLNDYRSAILYGMFYPMKLFTFSGIADDTMLQNALTACESFQCLKIE